MIYSKGNFAPSVDIFTDPVTRKLVDARPMSILQDDQVNEFVRVGEDNHLAPLHRDHLGFAYCYESERIEETDNA